MKKIFWYIQRSLLLDKKFLDRSPWPLGKKMEFLSKKYQLFFKHIFKNFKLGKDYITLFSDKAYYDSALGLAGFQSMLTRHQYFLQIAKVKKVKNVIDIGANVGFFSKMIRDIYPQSKIYCFEPVPIVFETLQKNFNKDKLTKCFNLALSDRIGSTRMSFDEQDSVRSSINKHGTVLVKTLTLDHFCEEKNISSVDILKIDVEGFENFVLKGSKKMLAKTKFLFLEITLKDNRNYTISSVLKLLSDRNFDFQLVAFRNYADTSEGTAPILDCLFENIKLKK